MLVHSVYFWLPCDIAAEKREAFETGIKGLTKIDSVVHGFWGKPAATNRPVIDRTYAYALTVIFNDIKGHDAYQAAPEHKEFLETFSPVWSKVVIYDSES
jgi:hypothetical protein